MKSRRRRTPIEAESHQSERDSGSGDLRVRNPSDWCDYSDEFGPPIPLGKPDGVGALQFSVARFAGGEPPNPSGQDLLELTLGYGRDRALGPFLDPIEEDGPPAVAAASFLDSDHFIRVWHVSDGLNFAFVTYVCDPNDQRMGEIAECEAIVRSVEFG